MKRRTYVAAIGTVGTGFVAGCQTILGSSSSGPSFSEDFEDDDLEDRGWDVESGEVAVEDSMLMGGTFGGQPFDTVAREIDSTTGRFTIEDATNDARFYGLRIGWLTDSEFESGVEGYVLRIAQDRNGTVDVRRNREVVETITDDHGGNSHDYVVEMTAGGDVTFRYDDEDVGEESVENDLDVSHLVVRFDGHENQRIDEISAEPL